MLEIFVHFITVSIIYYDPVWYDTPVRCELCVNYHDAL
jgi:hypothetical protein